MTQLRSRLSRRRLVLALAGVAGALVPLNAAAAPLGPVAAPVPATKTVPPPTAERWVQNHRATTVWADVDGTRALAPAPQWTYFRVVGATTKSRTPVLDPRLGAQGWVDAATLGPSGPPPAPAPAAAAPPPVPAAPAPAVAGPGPGAMPAPPMPAGTAPAGAPPPVAAAPAPTPPPFQPFWASPFRAAPLLLEPKGDAAAASLLPQFGPLQIKAPARDNFYPVEEPFSKVQGWVEAEVLGKIGVPSHVPVAHWWGRVVVDEAFARSAPSRNAPVVAQYPRDAVLGFQKWVEGEQVTWDDPAWGEIAPGVFVYGRLTRPIEFEQPPPPAVEQIPPGRWLGINRTLQAIVAYDGDKPQFWVRTSTGRPGWETPVGTYEVLRRVAKETMDSSTLLGRDAERASYKIENVKYTQYFTWDGNAIHENWWKEQDTFGLPSSHGCAGVRPDDALRLWEFATIGTPVIVHL